MTLSSTWSVTATLETVREPYDRATFSPHDIVGNLHLNIVAAAYTPEIEAALEPFVYELVGEYTLNV